jgi:hypothetical protein
MERSAGKVLASPEAWRCLEGRLDALPSSIASPAPGSGSTRRSTTRTSSTPLDRARLGYGVVAKMTQPLRHTMVEARYHEFAHGGAAAEFAHTPFPWNQAHRFVARRRPAALDPEAI